MTSRPLARISGSVSTLHRSRRRCDLHVGVSWPPSASDKPMTGEFERPGWLRSPDQIDVIAPIAEVVPVGDDDDATASIADGPGRRCPISRWSARWGSSPSSRGHIASPGTLSGTLVNALSTDRGQTRAHERIPKQTDMDQKPCSGSVDLLWSTRSTGPSLDWGSRGRRFKSSQPDQESRSEPEPAKAGSLVSGHVCRMYEVVAPGFLPLTAMQWVAVGEPEVQRQRGKWVVRVSGYDPGTGRRRGRQLGTFGTKRAASADQKAAPVAEPVGSRTVAEFLEAVWLPAKEGRVEVGTYDQYRWAVTRHIVPLDWRGPARRSQPGAGRSVGGGDLRCSRWWQGQAGCHVSPPRPQDPVHGIGGSGAAGPAGSQPRSAQPAAPARSPPVAGWVGRWTKPEPFWPRPPITGFEPPSISAW